MAAIGDIVLAYRDDQPAFFARIEDIRADNKPEWYHVKLLVLQVPVIEVVWILREAYINGDTFTMDGVPVRLEKIAGSGSQATQPPPTAAESTAKSDEHSRKVVPLFGRKKD